VREEVFVRKVRLEIKEAVGLRPVGSIRLFLATHFLFLFPPDVLSGADFRYSPSLKNIEQ
jgi:hypothetical protein